jgi:hypothetical protein
MNEESESKRTVPSRSSRLGLSLLVPAAAVLVAGVLLLGAGTSYGAVTTGTSSVHSDWGWGSTAPTYQVLDTLPLADSVVANTTDVFAAGQVNCSNVWAITPSGGVSVYASVPVNDSACQEGALALAPYAIPGVCLEGSCNITMAPNEAARQVPLPGGHNGCHNQQPPAVNQTLYYVINGYLFEIADGGSAVYFVTSFAVPSHTSENMGMTYDDVGTWNNDLVITSSSHGMVWTVNQTGVVTQVAELGTYIAGPAIAPRNFGAYGGDILVAEKTNGVVESINTTGATAPVTSWTKAIGVAFQSSNGGCGQSGCSFGSNHDIFFLANYTSGAIEGFPQSDFWNLWGQGIVAGGLDHGIAEFQPDGTTTLFASGTERLGYINFISCFPASGGWGHW